MQSISARLDRLPFARFHRRLLLIGGLGHTFDAMDSASLAFILPVVKKLWALTTAEAGTLASSTYLGYFFGAFIAGTLGDLLGRKKVMMSALAIYTIASLFCVFASDLRSFFLLRIAAGFGTGAESAIIAPYLAEFVGKRYRGKFTGSLAGFFSFGYLSAAVLGYLVIGLDPRAYQLLFVITALPILMLLWWRRTLPESPRWLESQGRTSEADAIVTGIESDIKRDGQLSDAPSPVTGPPLPGFSGTFWGNLSTLWSGRLVRITVISWFLWISIAFCYYAFFTWMPSLLVEHGKTISESFAFAIAIYGAQIPGYFSAAMLNDRLGSKTVIGLYMSGGAVSAGVLAMASTDLQIVLGGMVLSLFLNGAFGGLYAYTSEIFPTRVRATGMGTSSSIGRLGAITAPILVGIVFPVLGFRGVFGITMTVLVIGSVGVYAFGVQTRGLSLEAISNGDSESPAQ